MPFHTPQTLLHSVTYSWPDARLRLYQTFVGNFLKHFWLSRLWIFHPFLRLKHKLGLHYTGSAGLSSKVPILVTMELILVATHSSFSIAVSNTTTFGAKFSVVGMIQGEVKQRSLKKNRTYSLSDLYFSSSYLAPTPRLPQSAFRFQQPLSEYILCLHHADTEFGMAVALYRN
jgi:hypothetical protein